MPRSTEHNRVSLAHISIHLYFFSSEKLPLIKDSAGSLIFSSHSLNKSDPLISGCGSTALASDSQGSQPAKRTHTHTLHKVNEIGGALAGNVFEG